MRTGLVGLLTVAMAATVCAPATAQSIGNKNVGTGSLSGTVSYRDAGLPGVGEACEPTAFDLKGTTSQTFILNTVITGYLGTLRISGSGSSACENVAGGSGELAVKVTGLGPTGSRIDCPAARDPGALAGTYARTLTSVSLTVEGQCIINNYNRAPAYRFEAEAAFAPNALLGRIGEAGLTGFFRIAPKL